MVAVSGALCSAAAWAQDDDSSLPSVPDYFQEKGMSSSRAYDTQSPNESIDTFTGKLQYQFTDLLLPGNGVELQLDMWMLNHEFPDTELSRGFGVALFNDLNGRYASHHMSAEEVDATIGELQGAMTSSGPNYKPWRTWDEALLMSKSSAVNAHDPNVISPTALDWYDNEA